MIWLTFIISAAGMAAYLSTRSGYWAVVITRMIWAAAAIWAVGVTLLMGKYIGIDQLAILALTPIIAVIAGAKLLSWIFSEPWASQ